MQIVKHEHEFLAPEEINGLKDTYGVERVQAFVDKTRQRDFDLVLNGRHVSFMEKTETLGLDHDFRLKYYIGASWLFEPNSGDDESGVSIVVRPKIQNIDYIKMFLIALDFNGEEEKYFSDFYYIDYDKPQITLSSPDTMLTPLLLIHFIKLLEPIVARGLKRGYITRDENLKSKVKGKILFQRHLSKNILNRREDRVFCRYQEFSEDILENRLLKKALLFTQSVIGQYEYFNKYKNNFGNS